MDSIDKLERAIGLCTHHDSITGTSRKGVLSSYTTALEAGVKDVQLQLFNLIKTNVQKVFTIQDKDILIFNCQHNEYYYITCQDIYTSISIHIRAIQLVIYNPTITRSVVLKLKIPKVIIKLYDIRTNSYLVSDTFCDLF